MITTLLSKPHLRSADKIDWPLFWVVMMLLAFGLLTVYSATISGTAVHMVKVTIDGQTFIQNQPFYYLIRQAMFLVVFLIVLAIIMRFTPMRLYKRCTPYFVLFNLLLLLLVLVFGREISGAKRWLAIGFFNFQPAELFKLTVILYLASFLTRRYEILTNFKEVWYVGLIPALGMILIYSSTDLGSVIIITLLSLILLFIGGLRLKWFLVASVPCLLILILSIQTAPHRMERMMTFRNPEIDPYGSGFQIIHSLGAIAQGHFWGSGLGHSVERFYLPEIHTDFILSLIGEEWGMMGVIVLICIYSWLTLRAYDIGRQARRLDLFFSAYVAKGIALWLALQSFFHIGVNLGLVPTKGLTLPFISYGGSSLLVSMAAIALLLRIDYENRRKMRGYPI